MARKIVDATGLKPGDKIVTDRTGKVETVTKASTRESHGCVTIHTDQSDILTSLPAPVKVENR
jgi:hypothetical protein